MACFSLVSHTKNSSEGAAPNRAVRKGCYHDDVFRELRRCAT